MSDLITTEEAADLLRVSRQTVYRLLASGELRGLRLGHGPKARHRIELAELERLLHEAPAAAPVPPAADRVIPAEAPGTASVRQSRPRRAGGDTRTHPQTKETPSWT